MLIDRMAPALTPAELETNFADIKPPLTAVEAAVEAQRCLYCYDAPCMHACPTSIDVPEFIRRIGSGNRKGAAKVILEANILGATCARACPVQVLCEGACVYNALNKKPIEIGRLQRFATDLVLDGQIPLFQAGPATGKRVAVVGAGPAGLACAHEMRLLGHDVTVYDAHAEPGGLDTYGVAPYKITHEESLAEVNFVRQVGLNFVMNTKVGEDLSIAELEANFDAIFLAVGLGPSLELKIEGEDLPGVIGATEFIEQLRSRPLGETKVGRRVAVIGAGNTAIDAATETARLGADEVNILYRRGEREKPCYEFEYELAKRDNVTFHWLVAPVAIMGAGAVESLLCVRMRLTQPDASGRPRPEPIPGSEFTMPVDMVIKATGQTVQDSLFTQISGLKWHGRSLEVDPATSRTSNPRYFAAGDCANGGNEVVNAVAEGKKAARGIHATLTVSGVQ